MDFIEGADRNQMTLLPESIEDFITEDNPVRVIEAYISSLNLKDLEFAKHTPNSTGRPMYDPKDLLKLYLYGYMNRIRSSRKLEAETKRNLEVMWLLKMISPDHKTIARFRRDNPVALKNVFRDFVRLCYEQGFIGGELVAVDGSKFRAVNSKDRNFTKKKLDQRIGRIDAKISEYIGLLDETDDLESDDMNLSAADIKAIVGELAERRQRYTDYRKDLEETDQSQKSLTDPDSRLMLSNGKTDVCYNIQTAVDSKFKFITEFDVTNHAADTNHLGPMVNMASEVLGVESLTVVADKGYNAATDIAQCIREGHDPHVHGAEMEICIPADPGQGEVIESHTNGRTVYIPERNVAICPMGQILYPGYYRKSSIEGVFYNQKACNRCTCKCAKGKRYRFQFGMPESEFSKEYDDSNLEVKKVEVIPDRELVRQRKSIVEHPFGTLKRQMSSDHCLTKGIESVRGEFSLSFLAFNLKRAINIMGVPQLVWVLSS